MPARQLRLFPDPQPLVERLGRNFFQRVPECAGVYLMHGADEAVLYVGKAKNLRHRLNTYRVANPERMARRTLRLLRSVERIVWEECSDEAAATGIRTPARFETPLQPCWSVVGTKTVPRLADGLGWFGTDSGKHTDGRLDLDRAVRSTGNPFASSVGAIALVPVPSRKRSGRNAGGMVDGKTRSPRPAASCGHGTGVRSGDGLDPAGQGRSELAAHVVAAKNRI